jgi:hypothetical protein
MAFSHGKSTHFKIQASGDANATQTDISGYLKEVAFPRTADTAETTVFGASVKSFLLGITDAKVTVQGLFDPTIDALMSGIFGLGGREWVYGPQGSTAGNVKYSGTVAANSPLLILTSYQVHGAIGSAVEFSAEFQFTAQAGYATTAITRGTF